MGRQVNFYFVEEDERRFLDRLDVEAVTFLRADTYEEPIHKIYDEFQLKARSESSHSQTLICRTCDLCRLRFRKITGKRYYIDGDRSPVIEFIRSGYLAESNILVWGRIWYEHKYWDRDKRGTSILVAKEDELRRLYERLARWIRKHCKRLPNGNYIAPHAAELHAKGAKLSP